MSIFFNDNGSLSKEFTPVLLANNRAFRYGDGLFETMRILDGKILRFNLHFERLFNSLLILRYELPDHFSASFLKDQILQLLNANRHQFSARVRLTIFRGNGDLHDNPDLQPQFIIESWSIESNTGQWNTTGITANIYPDARKSCDLFSQLKTSNHLPYVMASRFAKDNKLQDAILLNTHGRVCDSTIANIFIIKDKEIFTPPLSEGCIAGTYRKYLLSELPAMGIQIIEKAITTDELRSADEIFLTNSIQQIRWVRHLAKKELINEETFRIYSLMLPTIE